MQGVFFVYLSPIFKRYSLETRPDKNDSSLQHRNSCKYEFSQIILYNQTNRHCLKKKQICEIYGKKQQLLLPEIYCEKYGSNI